MGAWFFFGGEERVGGRRAIWGCQINCAVEKDRYQSREREFNAKTVKVIGSRIKNSIFHESACILTNDIDIVFYRLPRSEDTLPLVVRVEGRGRTSI